MPDMRKGSHCREGGRCFGLLRGGTEGGGSGRAGSLGRAGGRTGWGGWDLAGPLDGAFAARRAGFSG